MTHFEGKFEMFVRPRFKEPPFVRMSGASAFLVSGALMADVREVFKGEIPAFWRFGLDRDKCLVELRPCEKDTPGFLRICLRKEAAQLASKALIRWLRGAGVPNARIPARWQPETQSIVGCYGQTPAAAQVSKKSPAEEKRPQTLPAEKPADSLIKTHGHTWQRSAHPGPSGNPIYRCEVCGYYTADPKNSVLKERKCSPGLYEKTFEVREDGRVYPKGWKRMTDKEVAG